ncbi:MAG: methylenetetrahydrofolate reductase [Gammaproteobacteria bacterium]|nr:methylenetetrahydrofolate reductase [Gammaproteobacteria bacterium]
MMKPRLEVESKALVRNLRGAYMEIFPARDIEKKLAVLERNSYVAVTCSPMKGIGATLSLTEHLVAAGFRVVPHIAAKNVRDRAHLASIITRLRELRVASIFVPGGDRPKPEGEFRTALELLTAISQIEHDFSDIGVAAHPEGHPNADDATMFEALRSKQELANYMVTQMCFDANALGSWLTRMRARGITLPVWIGLPGVINRALLLKTSLRIGVGDSLRYLGRNPGVAVELMKSAVYKPDELLLGLAPFQADPACDIAGYHLFCFNQVQGTEAWRHQSLEALA